MHEFGLLNIASSDFSGNGRFYSLSRINFGKPEIARMLSPDNYVQASDFTQNFNRYSYCLNNPLKYTDPSGNNYVSDMYHGNNGGGDYFTGFGSTNMSRILGDHSGFCDYNRRNERTVDTDSNGNEFDSKDYLTGKDAIEYLASIGIKTFEDLINKINGGENKKEGQDGGKLALPGEAPLPGTLSQIDLQGGGSVVAELIGWFAYINSHKNQTFHVSDIIDASTMPEKGLFNSIFGSMTTDALSGTSEFGDNVARWTISDRNFMNNYGDNYISHIYGDNPGGNLYRIRAMYNNYGIISITLYNENLYNKFYNQIFP